MARFVLVSRKVNLVLPVRWFGRGKLSVRGGEGMLVLHGRAGYPLHWGLRIPTGMLVDVTGG